MPQVLISNTKDFTRYVRDRTPFYNVDVPRSNRGLAWKTIESARAGFIGEATKRARQTLERIKDMAVEEVRMSGLARMAPEAVDDLLQRQRPRIKEMFRDIYLMVGTRFAERTAEQLRDGKSFYFVTKQDEEEEDGPTPRPVQPGGDDGGDSLFRPSRGQNVATLWEQEVDRILSSEGGGGELITNVTETTRNEIMDQVQAGVDEGEGIDRIARRIDENVGEINRRRARVIGRTETIRASNAGSHMAAGKLNIQVNKIWIATQDSRVRQTHAIAGGQTVPKNETFTVGGFPAQYPSDPSLPPRESISCRCTVAFERRNT